LVATLETQVKPEGKLFEIYDRKIFAITQNEHITGTPLIFLNCGPLGSGGWMDFKYVLPYFQDRMTVFPDLPEFGDSSKEPFSEPNWSYYAKYIAGMMDELGIEQADFAGSSAGGSTALALAANYPNRVRRIVMSGAQPTIEVPEESEEHKGWGGQWMKDFYNGEGPTREKVLRVIKGAEFYDDSRIPEERIQERLRRAIETQELATTPNGRGRREGLTDKLPGISAPCLFLWGRQDEFVPLTYVQRMADTVQYGEVHVMAKASHHLFVERPRDYSLIVRSFLDAELV
jgi:2-hydroxy-6-oxonona-2,4-dienedioate hydrolase